jgi:Protein of unknown function (DUF2384)
MAEALRLAPRERVPELRRRYMLTEQDLVMATGANVRTVRRWRPGAVQERWSRYDTQIDNLVAVLRVLSERFDDPAEIRSWLRLRNPALDNHRPLELLDDDNFFRVLQEAQGPATGLRPEDVGLSDPD